MRKTELTFKEMIGDLEDSFIEVYYNVKNPVEKGEALAKIAGAISKSYETAVFHTMVNENIWKRIIYKIKGRK